MLAGVPVGAFRLDDMLAGALGRAVRPRGTWREAIPRRRHFTIHLVAAAPIGC